MEKNNAKKIIVFSLLAALFFAAIFLYNKNITGFFSLQEKNQQQDNIAEKEEKVSAAMSFEIIKQTELEVSAQKTETMQCPQYVSLSFEAKNTGDYIAEGFSVEPSKNLKVLDCINCKQQQIKPKEKVTIKIKACRENAETAYVTFYSINSGEKRIGI